ncbi:erythromycin esterase family protein [Parapedobacter sp. DT-150]|uniref:erythromycin esterase family protein n=1 Tax=Parapedobacter sp. DT-150 TaxID=3396162 RepID=UPI003F5415A2
MKRFLIILVIPVVLILVINLVIYEEVPESIRTVQRAEIERYGTIVKSISITDTDYHDLQMLDSILVSNRVLMLGENVHHDGQTFKAKSRLIKYLHEHMGYHVVLYEAGQYDTWWMNKEMNERDNPQVSDDSIGGIGLFNFWWANQESKPLIDYYLKTKSTVTPIELGGFDIQFSGGVLTDTRMQLIKSFFAKNGINLESYPTFSTYLPDLHLLLYKAYADKRLDDKQKAHFLDEITQLEQVTSTLETSEENTMYARYLNDMRNNFFKSWKYESGSMASMHFRDSLMARNLIYQIDSVYTDQKVIVWCANIHTFASRYSKDYLPMGTYIKNRYGESAYMLNFSSYARYRDGNKIVDKPSKLAIENAFHATGFPYFFVDLKSLPQGSFLKHDFVSTINQGVAQKRVWSDFIDGIFYIDINRNPTYPEK